MSITKIKKIFKQDKTMILDYNYALDHGVDVFKKHDLDPNFILDIAFEGHYNGIILSHGLAEKYHVGPYKDIPLIIPLNCKYGQTTNIERSVKLGASGVLYKFFNSLDNIKSDFSVFSNFVETAHDYRLPVFADFSLFSFSRKSKSLYALIRNSIELGADVVVVNPLHIDDFKFLKKLIGKVRIIYSCLKSESDDKFTNEVYEMLYLGGNGVVLGRNIWLNEKPFSMSRVYTAVVHEKIHPKEAFKVWEVN